MFLDGLPLFIGETWAWGPSVPNYSAGGGLPNPGAKAVDGAGELRAAVADALRLYVTHSQQQGVSGESKEEVLERIAVIQRRFWSALAPFIQSEWPLGWRRVRRQLPHLRLPDSERERILGLKESRT
jgi:hypothetical protein